ncbi:MAG: hypothetical protein LC799_32350, partial [Actinobacteria bacterium]|nr:hypothetical protein [Actinomycetota bacterium]
VFVGQVHHVGHDADNDPLLYLAGGYREVRDPPGPRSPASGRTMAENSSRSWGRPSMRCLVVTQFVTPRRVEK